MGAIQTKWPDKPIVSGIKNSSLTLVNAPMSEGKWPGSLRNGPAADAWQFV